MSTAESALLASKNIEKPIDWKFVIEQWTMAIAYLKNIVETDPKYSAAQEKLKEYEKNLAITKTQQAVQIAKESEIFNLGIEAAQSAIKMSETAQTKQQWTEVIQQWETSIMILNSIPSLGSYYDQAQAKIQEYQENLNYAYAQLNQKF